MSKTELFRLVIKDALIAMSQDDPKMRELLDTLMKDRERWNKAIDTGVDVLYLFSDQIVELDDD